MYFQLNLTVILLDCRLVPLKISVLIERLFNVSEPDVYNSKISVHTERTFHVSESDVYNSIYAKQMYNRRAYIF